MTKKEAIELSIKKWEWVVENNEDSDIYRIFKVYPEMESLTNYCGLCEKYFDTSSPTLDNCFKCPIRPKVKVYNDKYESGCLQDFHPFNIWINDPTKKNAQAVLDLIKSIK